MLEMPPFHPNHARRQLRDRVGRDQARRLVQQVQAQVIDDHTATLTDAEDYIGTWVGTERRKFAVKNKLEPGGGATSRLAPDDATNDIMGAKGEYACSILLNLYWRPTIGQTDKPDVGGCIESRTTRRHKGHLIVPPNYKNVPYVLMLELDRYNYKFLGWLHGSDVASRFKLENRNNAPAYWVPQSTPLWPYDDLLKWIYGADRLSFS